MTRFRPCIDLHAGSVKQIVGGTLTDNPSTASALKTNFTSTHPAAYYAQLYRSRNCTGGHVIMLGPGNDDAATEALSAWPGGLQVGGGINEKNAALWLGRGAEKVIVTSFLFPDGELSQKNLDALLVAIGNDPSKLVIDLSCRRVRNDSESSWRVATNRWQTITPFALTRENIALLEPYCSEFLIHAADVEGMQAGIDEELVEHLSSICTRPVTYAGGGRNVADLELVKQLSGGKISLTIGSALDIFGGKGVTFDEACEWNNRQESAV